jgi:2',3'-cyclic-nucleotide 2'-phosphodiesterase (5'-nucleotidase family)
VARRATVIREQRSKAQQLLVLDAGASLSGEKDPAAKTKGASSVALMNRMGYDAMAVGLKDVRELGLAEFEKRMGEASFKILSANTYLTGTKELLATPYVIREMGSHRVAILGLTEAGATAEVFATDPIAAAREIVPTLQGKADIIVLLSHAGARADVTIAEQVPGVDFIAGGDEMPMDNPYNAKATEAMLAIPSFPRAGEAGVSVGLARFTFDRAGRRLDGAWQQIVLTPEIRDDPELAQLVASLSQ